MKIYIDVTETDVNKLKTGIQRVVREVVRCAENVGVRQGVEVVPVVAHRSRFYYLENRDEFLSPPPSSVGVQGATPSKVYFAIRLLKRLLRGFPGLYRLGAEVLYQVRRFRDIQKWRKRQKIEIETGDILLLLDSYWGRGGAGAILAAAKAKRQGCRVVAAVYDLIPVTHSQYYDVPLVVDFKRALNAVARVVDGFVCISNAVSTELRRYLGEGVPPTKIDYFHLGADFYGSDLGIEVSATNWPTGLWEDRNPVFIMVGTIEPRKGHAFVLDAFESAWRGGYAGKLLIVGKVGWKTEALIERLENSPEFGRRLFVLNHADDVTLGEIYRRGHACIIASYVEGFGLPLVEALQRGKPVMASDIPVFREIAGDFAIYFSHERPTSVMDAIHTLDGRYQLEAEKLKNFRWLSWEESTEQLLTKVVKMAGVNNAVPTANPVN